ncbi:unnamed protein product [Polarella glacialis]|uniref:Uncharacterized protein n=1 Tax=Polarella glacialis TaxID=89957 RepID=A0A813INE9_POLGL|nr:unnamed protein product [Polarella glacialis]
MQTDFVNVAQRQSKEAAPGQGRTASHNIRCRVTGSHRVYLYRHFVGQAEASFPSMLDTNCFSLNRVEFPAMLCGELRRAVTSHDFGWHADSPTSRARGLPRHPVHGMTQSESTRYVHNMKATLSEASMRLIL